MTDIKSIEDEIYRILLEKRIIPSLTYAQPTNWFGNNMAARWTIAARPAETNQELEKSSAYFRSRLIRDVLSPRGLDALPIRGRPGLLFTNIFRPVPHASVVSK